MILFFPFTPTITATPGVQMTGADLVKLALQEIAVLNAVEDPGGEDADTGLAKCNLILDRWNVQRKCAFAETLTPYALTPHLAPHTIGPTGTWVVVQRPVTIEAINWITGTTHAPITLRDREWYLNLGTPSLEGIPTDLYYEPSFPNGTLNFYPVPSVSDSIELMVRGLLSAVTLTTQLSLPPGYRDALMKTLAEELVGVMHVPMPQLLPMQAKEARAVIFEANVQVPRLTSDFAHGRGSFDYRTGRNR